MSPASLRHSVHQFRTWLQVHRAARRTTRPLVIHYLPDYSGGAATFLPDVARALFDYDHVFFSVRGFGAALWNVGDRMPPVSLVTGRLSAAQVRRLQPHAIFNHLSWDLDPICVSDLPYAARPLIVSFFHSRGVMERLPADHADKVVFFSKNFENGALEARFAAEYAAKAETTSCFVDERELSSVPLQGRLRDGHFVVGDVTNGAPWKHAADYVDICRSLDVEGVVFRFLGAKDLKDKVAGLERAEVLAPYTEKVRDYLTRTSVLFHRTSAEFAETWCRAVTEAMLAGVPVVAEKKGGIRDQIEHGRTGFLCSTPQDFRACLEALAGDERLYREIASAARDHAIRNFGRDACRNRMQELLTRASGDVAVGAR